MESDIVGSALTKPVAPPPEGQNSCLIVLAHPLGSSLNAALAGHVRTCAEARNWSVGFRDLYASGFQSALSAGERVSCYGGRFDAAGVAAEIAELDAAEVLILVCPTWWFGFPAVLKGWFDRVWAPGYAYDHSADHGGEARVLSLYRAKEVSPRRLDRFLARIDRAIGKIG